MLDILKSIKLVIEKFVVNMTPLLSDVSAGDTIFGVASTRRYCPGDHIVVYSKPSASIQAEGEVHAIVSIHDNNIIEIDAPLVSGYDASYSYVEKLIGFETGNQQFLEAVYIGEPDVIPRFPAITVDGKSRSSEWLTLESTSETYEIDITVYVQAADYESQFELMQTYVKNIERSLFRTFYPLVRPYDVTTLVESVSATSNLIRITDESLLTCLGGWIWLESWDFLRFNRVLESLGNGVYRLLTAVGEDFAAGDKIIRPRRHIYNTLPHSTRYGTVNKGSMLKAAVISYKVQEEVRRFVPFIDPLTF